MSGVARLYQVSLAQRASLEGDRVALAKAEYDLHGDGRTNLRDGYVRAS